MPSSYSLFSRKSLKTITIVLSSMTAAFLLGIETAGDLHPVVSETRAGGTVLDGDFNKNGVIDIGDAKIALELAMEYRTPTPDELAADPNQDFHITSDDVMTIINRLQEQSK